MFTGTFAALLTPFDRRGDVVEESLRGHVEWLIGKGIDGLYVCGNTGQGVYLSVAERQRVLAVVKDQAAGRCRLIAHVATLATRDAQALAAHASDLGVDAIASLAPIYWAFREDEIVGYYRDLVQASRGPCLMYVWSGPGMADLGVDTVLRVAEIAGVVGMKYTSPDFFRMQAICQRVGRDWVVLSGPDELFLPALTMGVQGSIGTTQNVFPELFAEIQRCFQAGDLARAMAIQQTVTRIVSLYKPYGSAATAHTMLTLRGLPLGLCRAPFTAQVPPNEAARLLDTLRQIVAACPVPLHLES
jgi:N-acetylneuraminate lyase